MITRFSNRLFVLLTFCLCEAMAQDPINVIPPSPEAAAIAKYGQIPVTYYNGLTNISIPLFELSSRDLTFPVNLNYHPSGIKVGEEATWVGLGWTLSANGAITRTIYGKDDFDDSWYFNSSIPDIPSTPFKYLNVGCIIDYYDDSTQNTASLDLTNYAGRGDQYEFQPDIFSFNVPGASGKFYLDRNRSPILQSLDKVEITCSNNDCDKWTIRTSDGTSYYFDIYEEYIGDYQTPQPSKSAWYLTKVVSNKGTQIEFVYDQSITYTRPLGSISIYEETITTCDNNLGNSKTFGSRREYRHQYLSEIIYDHAKLIFSYDNQRQDLEGAKKLNKIEMFKKKVDGTFSTTAVKKVDLNYSYFDGNGGFDGITNLACPGGYYSKRLRLDDLEIIGENASLSQRYDFDYFDEGNNQLPCKTSFAQDHWGYYNGMTSNSTLIPEFKGVIIKPAYYYAEIDGADRTSNGDFAKAYTLKSIEYPTGGSVNFLYEGHEYDEGKSNINDLSDFYATPPIKDRSVEFLHSGTGEDINYLNLNQLYVDEFTSENSTVEVQAVFRCNSNCDGLTLSSNQVYFELYDPNGSFLQTIDFFDIGCTSENSPICLYEQQYTNIDPGVYIIKAYVDPSISGIADLKIIYRWSEEIEKTSTPIVSAGGLRISEIEANPIHGLHNSQKFNYSFKEDSNNDGTLELTSSGIRMSRPQYSRYYYDPFEPCFRLIRSSDSNIPLSGSSIGASVGYTLVEVLSGKTESGFYGTGGRTLYEYHNQPDYIKSYEYQRVPGIPNLTNSLNGMLKSQTDYGFKNGEFLILGKVENSYQESEESISFGILKTLFFASLATVNEQPCDVYLFIYPINSVRVQLAQTKQTIFDMDDPVNEWVTTTDYEYDVYGKGHYQLSKTTTTGSDGEIIVSETLYPEDPGTNAPSRMWDSGDSNYSYMHSYPVITKALVDGIETNKVINTYDFEGDNLVLDKVDAYRSGNAGLSTQTNKYDTDGNLLETSIDGGMKVAYLWGYNNTIPIAKIENADQYQVYFNGFENDVNATENEVNSRTGNRYTTGSYNVTFAPPGGTPYIITYWKYLNATGEWEFVDEQTYSFNFQITADRIDDIRVYPQNARMTTYTYNVMRGITSMTDPNNVTTFYEYDDSGRLEHVLDQFRNKVKSFDYQYLNQN